MISEIFRNKNNIINNAKSSCIIKLEKKTFCFRMRNIDSGVKISIFIVTMVAVVYFLGFQVGMTIFMVFAGYQAYCFLSARFTGRSVVEEFRNLIKT